MCIRNLDNGLPYDAILNKVNGVARKYKNSKMDRRL